MQFGQDGIGGGPRPWGKKGMGPALLALGRTQGAWPSAGATVVGRMGRRLSMDLRGGEAAGRAREAGRVDGPEIGREGPDQYEAKEQRAADRDGRMVAQEAEDTAPDFHRQQQVRQLRRDDKARRDRHSSGGRDAQ